MDSSAETKEDNFKSVAVTEDAVMEAEPPVAEA